MKMIEETSLRGLKWLRKNTELVRLAAQNHPSAAKAALILRGLDGTDKSVPLQNSGPSEVSSAACEAHLQWNERRAVWLKPSPV
jgi:hypothetical protein